MDADLIGLSFMSQYFDRAAQITEHLKKRLDIPIIWGGTHPTCRPDQCIQFSDMICIGEGDLTILELVEKLSKKESYSDIKNCWFKKDGRIIKNIEGEIIQNLDELPYLDYDLEDHYVLEPVSNDIIQMDDTIMKRMFLLTPYFKDRIDVNIAHVHAAVLVTVAHFAFVEPDVWRYVRVAVL